ncbi:MAG: hypothetical protein CMH57_08945 [Myxococcales bacterium]|nr:hypothetical protein [Myxococcales bacterium]
MVQMRRSKGLTGRDVLAFQGDGVEGIQVNRRLTNTDVHQAAAEGLTGSARPLPYLEQIQKSFGEHDVTGVKAYIGGAAQTASDKMGALAYAAGDSIAFRDTPDLRLVAHEAAHVIQQRAGVQLADGVGRIGDIYEQHADMVADRVVAGRSAEALLNAAPSGGAVSGLVQFNQELETYRESLKNKNFQELARMHIATRNTISEELLGILRESIMRSSLETFESLQGALV